MSVLLPIESSYHARKSRRKKPPFRSWDTLGEPDDVLTPHNDRRSFVYLANVTLGEPAQTLSVQIDCHTQDFWVQASSNPGCRKADLEFCAIARTYSRGRSRTGRSTNIKGRMLYDDGTYARVSAVFDGVGIAGHQMNMSFGLSSESTALYGRLGLLKSDAVGGPRADVLINSLVAAKIINTPAFSLYIDNHRESTGAILFGGIDTRKFEGPLLTLPRTTIVNQIRNTFFVYVDSISMIVDGTSRTVTSSRMHALLDPTSSWSHLPYHVASRLARRIGGTKFDAFSGTYSIDCSRLFSPDLVVFNFWGVEIPVTLNQIISRIDDSTCALAFTTVKPQYSQITPVQEYSIGDSILRSAYVVYDYQNRIASIAKLAEQNEQSDIIVLTNGVPENITGRPLTPLPITESQYAFSQISIFALIVLIMLSIFVRRKRRWSFLSASQYTSQRSD